MASLLPDLATQNISLNTIPFMWLISLSPRFYGRKLYRASRDKDMDARHPPSFCKQVAEDKSLDNLTRNRILRCEAAVANGLENMGLYAAAVVAGTAAGLSPRLLNGLSLGYLASRLVYNYIYVFNETKTMARARTLLYGTGITICFTLFIQAGKKFRQAAL